MQGTVQRLNIHDNDFSAVTFQEFIISSTRMITLDVRIVPKTSSSRSKLTTALRPENRVGHTK
jgi:hypothetical protein